MNKEINCTVYKSLKKDETYVFIPTEMQLSDLPDELKKVQFISLFIKIFHVV